MIWTIIKGNKQKTARSIRYLHFERTNKVSFSLLLLSPTLSEIEGNKTQRFRQVFVKWNNLSLDDIHRYWTSDAKAQTMSFLFFCYLDMNNTSTAILNWIYKYYFIEAHSYNSINTPCTGSGRSFGVSALGNGCRSFFFFSWLVRWCNRASTLKTSLF